MKQSSSISGRVTRIGYYRDTLPQLIIVIKKEEKVRFQWQDGARLPLTISLSGEAFRAGVRATLKSENITICPDLHDAAGNEIRLADLLLAHNIQQKTTVALEWDGETVNISKVYQ